MATVSLLPNFRHLATFPKVPSPRKACTRYWPEVLTSRSDRPTWKSFVETWRRCGFGRRGTSYVPPRSSTLGRGESSPLKCKSERRGRNYEWKAVSSIRSLLYHAKQHRKCNMQQINLFSHNLMVFSFHQSDCRKTIHFRNVWFVPLTDLGGWVLHFRRACQVALIVLSLWSRVFLFLKIHHWEERRIWGE